MSKRYQIYERAKFVVEANAKKQAYGDSSTLQHHRIQEVLDPLVDIELIPNLKGWVVSKQGDIIFRGVSQPDYEALTYTEKQTLKQYWVTRYLEIVREKLQERVKGNKQ